MPTGKITPTKQLNGLVDKSSGTFDHEKLINRDQPDQHPIEAITGLTKTLTTINNTEAELAKQIEDEHTFAKKELDKLSSEQIKLTEKIATEATRATKAESCLVKKLNDIRTELGQSITEGLKAEQARATEAEANLQTEIKTVTIATKALETQITAEKQARIDADSNLATAIEKTSKKAENELNTEKNRAIDAENQLNAFIETVSADLSTKIATEEATRAETDTELENKIKHVQKDLATETELRDAAIKSEQTAREKADEALRETVKKDIEPKLEKIEDEIKELEKSIGKDIKEKVEALQKKVTQEATDRAEADKALETKIEDIVKELPASIEELTTIERSDTSGETGYYLAATFLNGLTYYEKTNDNTFVKIELTAETFIPNIYYVYRKHREPKIEYIKAKAFDATETYYEYTYDVNLETSVGMWIMPQVLDMPCLNAADIESGAATVPIYNSYSGDLNAVRLKYYWYDRNGAKTYPIIGRICVNDESGTRPVEDKKVPHKTVLSYGNWVGTIPGYTAAYDWYLDRWACDEMRTIYVEDSSTNPWYSAPSPTAKDLLEHYKAIKVSDELLGWGDTEYKMCYKEVTLTKDQFAADKYYVKKIADNEKDYVVTRIEINDETTTLRGATGNDVIVITEDNVKINGENLAPNLQIASGNKAKLVLENNAEITYDEPLRTLKLIIPTDIKHGFCSSVVFESGVNFVTELELENQSNYNFRIIWAGQQIKQEDLELSVECQYNLLFLCNGINVELYIQEIPLR